MHSFKSKKLIVLILTSTFILASAIGSVDFNNNSMANNNNLGMVFANGFEPDLLFANGFENPDGANIAPIANDDSYSALEDIGVDITLTATDGNNDTLSYQVVTQPVNGVLSGSAPDLTYTPHLDFNGTDQFEFIANDGQVDSQVGLIQVIVNPVNDAPVAIDQNLTHDEDTSLTMTLTAQDAEEDSLTYSIIDSPLNGILSGTIPNLVYTPSLNYFGSDSFTFKVNDAEFDSNSATVSLTINSINDQASADALVLSTAYQTPLGLPLSGSDVEDAVVTFQIQTQPTHGSVTENAGVYTYTPDDGYAGTDQLTYVAIDSAGLASEVVTVDITVEQNTNLPPEITSIAPTSASVGIDIQYDVEAIDPDGDVLNYELLNAPLAALIDQANGLISWTPETSYSIGLDSDNLQCKFSSGQTGDYRQLQLITLIDGSGSMSGERAFLSTWLPQLNGEMLSIGLGQNDDLEFSIGKFSQLGVLQILPSGSHFGTIDEISNVLVPITDLAGPGGGNENGVNSMTDILEDYQYNEEAQQIFIMMTDERCASCPNAPQRTALLNDMLAERNDVLHTVIPTNDMTCPDGRSVMGIDNLMNGYVAEGNGNFSVCQSAVFENLADDMFEHYVEPAFLTGGSVWDVRLLSGLDENSRSAAESIAKVIAKIAESQATFAQSADLFISEVNQTDEQLIITVKNRGVVDSLATNLEITDVGGQVLTFAIPVLMPSSSEVITLDKNAVAAGEITVDINLTEECVSDNNQVKLAYFLVEVDDNNNGTDSQAFYLSTQEDNQAPTISQIDDVQTPAGIPLSLSVIANDPNKGDVLSYTIVEGSEQATVNPSGLLEWVPTTTDVGITQPFTIRVTDLAGAFVESSFSITVVDGIEPLSINSEPVINAAFGELYEYQVEYSHDPLSQVEISLLNAVDDMTVDTQGLISWDVPNDIDTDLELVTVVLVVEDQFGNSDTQSFLLVLDEPPSPPVITSLWDTPTELGEDMAYWAEFSDINAFESFTLEFLDGPAGIYFNNFNPPFPDFQYENVIAINRWDNVTTVIPENKFSVNHWCGADDPAWVNLTPQIADTVELGFSDGDTLNTNLLATSLTDTNNDGMANQADTQYLIYIRDNGIAAMNARTLVDEWFQPNVRAARGGFSNPLAAADLDQDGNNEIIVMDLAGFINALSPQGEVIWTSSAATSFGAATRGLVATEDLDADGDLEIIAGTYVFDHLGDVVIDFGQQNFINAQETFAATGDIDQDGTLEIIYNDTVYNHDGSVLYSGFGAGNFYAIANFDTDAELEWVQVNRTNNTVTLFDHDATLLWQQTVQTANLPSVADVDFDGSLEIMMTYATLKADGTVIRDQAGDSRYDSVLTDLNLDGAYELISSWAQINAIDPITGDQIFEWKYQRGYYDFVLIDRFSDGNYQIAYPYFTQRGPNNIAFIKSADDQWRGGPGETKQTYFNQALTIDGESGFTSGVLLEQAAVNNLSKDLHVTGPQLEEATGGERLYTELRNLTPSIYSGDLLVDFYFDEILAANLLGSTTVNGLGTNQATRIYLDTLIDPYNAPGSAFIAQVIPVDNITECRTDNNQASSEFVHWQVIDKTGLSDQQAYNIRVKNADLAPASLVRLSVATAWQNYQEQMTLFRYDDNDDVFFLVYDKPDGMEINADGVINWLPTEQQVGSHTITMYVQDDAGNNRFINTTITVEPSNNQAPYITSVPENNLLLGTEYQYQVMAIDPEGAALTYVLEQGPSGATINSNGLLTWTPDLSAAGDYTFDLKVIDQAQAFVTQNFTLNISSAGNTPPEITSTPDLSSLLIGESFSYQVISSDAEGDQVTYQLLQAPFGALVDATSGLIEFDSASVGVFEFVVEARDSNNAWSTQSFTLFYNDAVNTNPSISSTPEFSHPLGSSDYSYHVVATDPESDPLSYRLLLAPIGMSIDDSGLLVWPLLSQVSGAYSIEIEVSDGRGGLIVQNYDLTLGNGSSAPTIDSIPALEVQLNRLYQYQIVATDADTPVLNYQLIQAPTGMIIDNTGLISWTPDILGLYTVVTQVSDGISFVRQNWTIDVKEVVTNLDATITLTPALVLADEDVMVQVDVLNAVGTAVITATLDGQGITLDANNEAIVSSADLGTHIVSVEVTDDVETIVAQAAFVVGDPNDTDAPEVDILSPEDGGIVTGFNDIRVRVQDENLVDWKLSYRYSEDDFTGRVTLAEGTDAVDDAIVASWDTSLLLNGIYVLLIEGTDLNGQRSSIAHSVFLEGDLKLGHFSIAFEDLNIPVAGIPITITRGYDTRDRNRDRAFGKGWSIGYQSVRVQESRVPGLAWYQETGFFSIGPVTLPRYCIEPAGQPLVSVVLPDGQVEKFKVKARTINPSSDILSNCQDITPPQLFSVEFVAQGDTYSTLSSNTGLSGLSILNGNLEELATNEPIDPNLYTLTMLNGTEYSLDQGFNVVKIKATSGHELRFTENGIEHSGGLSVVFTRDSEGRITRIEKADGDGVDYSYDINGDLASFTDLNGNTTTYTYIQDHYLEDIMDPRGIMVARNEYDTDGRLVAHIDAMGNRIEYDNDLIAMTSTITDRRGNATVNAFDNAGNIIAQTNALGETTSYEYNSIRLETARINHLGHRTEWTYDSQGNQLTETDPLGEVTTSTYNHKAELLTQVDALNQPVITNEYNPDYNPLTPSNPQHGYAQLKQVTDTLGRTTEFHWLSGINPSTEQSISVNTGFTDANGNRYDITPISGGTNDGLSGASADLNGLRTETTYDDEARPLTESQIITDTAGDEIARYTTTYQYNENGDITSTTDPLTNTTSTEYNELNKVSASIDPLGRRTEYQFDDRGNQVLTRFPDNSTETMLYDQENNLIETTDRAGRTTKTIYDALNRAIAVISPDSTPGTDADNPMTTNIYDPAGRLVGISDPLGNTTTYEYDDAGRRTKTTDSLGNQTTSVYDQLGRRTSSTDALGRVTTFQYNTLGNLIQTTFDNGTFTSTTYDQLNRKTSETDLAGRTTSYEYSNAGNLTAVIDSLGQRTEYTYDQRGNKLTQTDAGNNTTSWTYDELNRVISRTLPMGEVETYSYNAVGNQISKTDFNGDTTTYSYNNLNQLITTTYGDNSTVTNTYTITSQIESITEVNGQTSYQYDEQNRLTRIDYPTGNFIAYQYDLNGNRTQINTSNQTIDSSFDQLNRLATVTDPNGVTNYSYDSVGNRSTQTNANGTVATYSYDQLNRLLNLNHTDSIGTNLASYQYTLGANGNRLSLTEGTGRVVDFTYDALYRLLTETVTDPINGNHQSEFSYDPVGNRLQQEIDGIVTTYIYNNNDHLLSETENGVTTSYVYDSNGNTLSKTIDAILDTQYTYSKDNRMLQAQTSSSTIINTYDAGGIRQSQIVDGLETRFLVDPNRAYAQVIEELDSSNIVEVTYVYGDDLLTQNRSGTITTYGYDGLGSTRILTDSTGAVQNSYGYRAFGEIDYQLGTVSNNYLFTGEQYDNNIGFYYLRARFYNPSIGRFQNMDTFPGLSFDPVTLHKYLYANGNPSNIIDPSGNIGIVRLMTTVNVAGSIQAYATIGVNILTGNYAVAAGQIAEEVVYAKLGVFGRPLSKLSNKAANLFYNVFGRNIKLRRGANATGANLAYNLRQVGVNRPAQTSAHHIVAGNGVRARRARDILEDFDIDINSPNNGVFLPNRATSPAIGSLHSGRHTNAYFDEVNDRIIAAAASGDKVQVLNELGKIKLDLLSGSLQVQNVTR